jgi:hypothetical protein
MNELWLQPAPLLPGDFTPLKGFASSGCMRIPRENGHRATNPIESDHLISRRSVNTFAALP